MRWCGPYRSPHEYWHIDVSYISVEGTFCCLTSVLDGASRFAVFVAHYNIVRFHSAIGYLTPADKLNSLEQVIFAERDRKFEVARQRRQQARQSAREIREPSALQTVLTEVA